MAHPKSRISKQRKRKRSITEHIGQKEVFTTRARKS